MTSSGDGTTDPGPFILTGPPDLVKALIDVVVNDPELELVSVSGPPGQPERFVARMPAARADLLRRALGGQLLVEPDEELHPFT